MEFAGLEEDASEESAEDTDDDLHLPNPNAEKANSQHGKSLEVLLATKNKRILEELTKFRVRRVSGMICEPELILTTFAVCLHTALNLVIP